MRRLKLTLLLICSLATSFTFAKPYYGGDFSYAITAKEPPNLRGYQFTLFYDPQQFQWRKFNVYVDGGFSHFWDTKASNYTSVNIYSVAPVVRYTFKKHGPVLPYLELSIGFSYINHTHFEDRNLGIHFAFQDRFGIGTLLGQGEQLSVGLHAVHYSNAHLANNNSGITVPLLLDIGYRFS